jgi:hypothetical protein
VKRGMSAGRMLAVVAGLLLYGCSGSNGRPTTYPVSGQVFVNDQPAAGAMVELHAVGGDPKEKNLCPHALVAADGTFRLTTFQTNDGAPAGTYAVTVKWPGPPKPGHEQGTDRLQGRYASPQRPARQVQITAGVNEVQRLDLK